MSAKDLHKEPFSEETILKLDIFEKYLESWLPVAIQTPFINEVNICDFFAGTGRDIEGINGSPLRIIKVIKKFADAILSNKLQLHIIFNEFKPNKYKNLCECVSEEQKLLKNLDSLLNIECSNQDFKKLFGSRNSALKNSFNLFFLDQSGVKQVTEKIFSEIASFPKTDFMFFVSSSFLKRFPQCFQQYFPDINRQEIYETEQPEMHRQILQYYRSKIPKTVKVKLYPFTIKKGPNIYGLIFGSHHPLGVEKFLKIAWETNELNGEANFDIDEDWKARQGILFGDKKLTKLEKYEHELEKYILSKKKISNVELYDFTLESGHIPKHTVNALSKLRGKGRISYTGHPNISYNKCYKNRELKYFKIKP